MRYWLLIILSMTGGLVQASDLAEQVKIESFILERVELRLATLLSPDRYRIMVAAEVERTREKVVDAGEDESKLQEASKASNISPLPGFINLLKPKLEQSNIRRSKKTKFSYREKTQLKRVLVDLILDTDIDQEKKTYLSQLIKEDLESSVGSALRLNIKEFDLSEIGPQPSVLTWARSYANKRLSALLDVLAIALIVLLSLMLLASALKQFMKAGKVSNISHAFQSKSQTSGDGQSQEAELEKIGEHLDSLVKLIGKSSLEARTFLKGCQDSSKAALIYAIESPTLRELFRKFVEFDGPLGDLPLGKVKESLNRLIRDLDRYLTLQEESVQKRFGYLNHLENQDLIHYIEASEDPVNRIALLSGFASSHQLEVMLDTLNLEQKAEVYLKLQSSPASNKAWQAIDKELRDLYESNKNDFFGDSAGKEQLESLILENESQIHKLVAILKEKNIKLAHQHRKYLVDFDGLLGLDLKLVQQVFQSMSNETLAAALKGKPLTKYLEEAIGNLRIKLVQNIMDHSGKVDDKTTMNARKEVLRGYRSLPET